jgi:hypothetical protein
MSNKETSVLKFTVNGKPYATKHTVKAQNFIISELNSVYSRQFNVEEAVEVNKEMLRYAVINPDGTYAGSPCTSEEEARELAAQKEGRIIVELGKPVSTLTEGIFDKLKSRSAKADWILEKAVDEQENKRFDTFIVLGFKNTFSNGKEITAAPSLDNKDLVLQTDAPKQAKSYKEADDFAKGWSMKHGHGPAIIYMAKDIKDPEAAPVCEYFDGALVNDQLDKYFESTKNDIKGDKLMKRTASHESTNDAAEESTNESLTAVMDDIEDLQESLLEKFISDSLVESYGNVAGFRLTDCAYVSDKFTVDGTIYFTSGNTRKTTYTFSEAYKLNDGKIKLRGLNEKLGIDRQFTIIGSTDDNKMFITESFTHTK